MCSNFQKLVLYLSSHEKLLFSVQQRVIKRSQKISYKNNIKIKKHLLLLVIVFKTNLKGHCILFWTEYKVLLRIFQLPWIFIFLSPITFMTYEIIFKVKIAFNCLKIYLTENTCFFLFLLFFKLKIFRKKTKKTYSWSLVIHMFHFLKTHTYQTKI